MKNLIRTVVSIIVITITATLVAPSPAYAQSWMLRQQMVRQNQMAQQRAIQQQQQAARAQQRRQQKAMQQQRIRQQQTVRAQQQRMRQQMVQRQQTAARQRQAMAQKQRTLQLQRQKRIQSSRPKNRTQRATTSSSSSKQKALQQQRTLRQQRLAKDRADRLKRLRLERKKKDQKTAKTNQSNNVVAMSAVATRIRSTPRTTVKATDRNSFRQTRLNQQKQIKITKQLADQRKFVQTRAKRILELQKRLKQQNKTVSKPKDRTKQVQAKAEKQFKSCNGKSCGECSFHGDTNVLTRQGFIPIRDLIASQTMVWARDEFTGISDWKRVTNHYSNNYQTMIYLELSNLNSGDHQVIRTNKLHPFFVENSLRPVSLNTQTLRIAGAWVAADDLKIGDSLSTTTDSNAVITNIDKISQSFEAFNLTVEDFHTYFVRGQLSTGNSAVWVHNDCHNTKQTGKVTTVARPSVSLWKVPVAVKSRLPSTWISRSNKKGIGTRWQDPANKGNGVRVDKGNKKHKLPSQRVDHVIVRKDGKVLGRNGKPIDGSIKNNAAKAHIPLSEYKKWKSWDSPV